MNADRHKSDKRSSFKVLGSVFIRVNLWLASSLERKERFELSSRVWKTRMFPATSLPRKSFATKKHKKRLRTHFVFLCFFVTKKWSGRTESNCHHEFPGLGCERYTTPRIKNGGTERTRTVIDLIDNQVPHPSATVPLREIWAGRRELNPHAPQSQCGTLPIELRPTYAGDK